MAQTTSDALAAAIQVAVQADVLKNLRAQLVFADPAYAEEGEFTKGTDALLFVAFADLAINTTALTEGTNPTPKALTMTTVSVDTAEYGDSVNLSNVAKIKSAFDLAGIAAERITRQAAESIDKVSRDAIALGGTPFFVSADHSTRATLDNTDVFTSALAQNLYATMSAAKIPMLPDGKYRLFVHPYVAYDIKSDTTSPGGFLDVNRYSNPQQIMSGEIGLYHGFHVIEVNNAPTFSSGVTVYASFAVGAVKGWGMGRLDSLSIHHVAPGGDHSDLLGLSELVGWHIIFGVAPLNNSYYYRAESGTAYA